MSANVTHLAFGYGIQADVYYHIMIILTNITFPSIALACASTPNDTLTPAVSSCASYALE